MRYYYDYSFPIGNLTIEEDGHGICGIYFGTKMLEGEKKNTELIREAALQLSQYFDGRRKKFDLKLSYHGTEFQIKVWKALKDEGLKSRLILQVHDELLIETAQDEEARVRKILTENMKSAADLAVTLEIDLHTGSNWYEAK